MTAIGIPDEWRDRLEQLADFAITQGAPVVGVLDGFELYVIPDVYEIEGVANGKPALPDTVRLRRADGRSVALFQYPIEVPT